MNFCKNALLSPSQVFHFSSSNIPFQKVNYFGISFVLVGKTVVSGEHANFFVDRFPEFPNNAEMPGSQSAAVLAGSSANNYCILDGNDSQNADMMDFDDSSGPADPRLEKLEKQHQQLLHADFYNDFGDLFDNIKV